MFDKVRFVRDVGVPDPAPPEALESGRGPVRSHASRGEVGTVVDRYTVPGEGYEIEVMKGDSYYTLALVAAGPNDLELVGREG